MRMIRHAIDSINLLAFIFDNTSNIFLQVFPKRFYYETFSSFHSKNGMYIDLGIGVSHILIFRLYGAQQKNIIATNLLLLRSSELLILKKGEHSRQFFF